MKIQDVPKEVTHAPLTAYSDASLAGRLAHYEREALFERDAQLRAAWRREAEQTRTEIERRKRRHAPLAELLFEPRAA